MEAPAPHFRYHGGCFHAGAGRLYFQCAPRTAPAGTAAAQRKGTTIRLCRTAPRLTAMRNPSIPPAAKPTASPPRFPSIPARVCAPPTTSRTTQPATRPSRSTSTRSTCFSRSGCMSIAPSHRSRGHQPIRTARSPSSRAASVHDPDDLNKVKHVIQEAHEDTEIFPHLNNFNSAHAELGHRAWAMCSRIPPKRNVLRQEIVPFLHRVSRLSRPFARHRKLPDEARTGLCHVHPGALLGYASAQSSPLRQRRPCPLPADELKTIAANSDGMMLMNYDEHESTSATRARSPARTGSSANLTRVLKIRVRSTNSSAPSATTATTGRCPSPIPRPAIPSCASLSVLNTEDISHVSDAWQRACDADADLDLDYNSLNPHFEYIDEDTQPRHVVWFLDGVTLLNEMRAARGLGLQTFALWRLGCEDGSMWNIWDKPSNPASLQALGTLQPGHDVDTEGDGDILRVTGLPQTGKRTVHRGHRRARPAQKAHHRRAHGCVSAHLHRRSIRLPSQRSRASPSTTAPIPSGLRRSSTSSKQKNVKGTFMMIGAEAAGEHRPHAARVSAKATRSATTPSRIPTSAKSPPQQLDLEVKLTERLFASKLGVQPLYFRPPYDIDEEPDTDDQAAPVVRIQQLGSPSSATRSTPTTGTSTRARRPQEIIAVGPRPAATP